MKPNSLALLWAAIIIAAALIMSEQGVNSAVATGVVMGLSGAAWGMIARKRGSSSCKTGCAL